MRPAAVVGISAVVALSLAVPVAGAQTPAPAPGTPAPPPGTPAPPPAPDRITILAVFKTVNIGEPSFISGRFRRQESPAADAVPYADRTVTLEQAPYPFTVFTPVASAVTEREGYYSFKVVPQLNTRYRVSAADPLISSVDKLIRARIKVTLELKQRAARRGRLIELSGLATPAHVGARVEIQQRREEGPWKAVDETTLRDDGAGESIYLKRLRVRRSASFRVRVLGDPDHLPGISAATQPIEVDRDGTPRDPAMR